MFQLLASVVAGFAVGLITRFLMEKTAQKKMLKMENTMLKNHSRILALQQKISFLEKQNTKFDK